MCEAWREGTLEGSEVFSKTQGSGFRVLVRIDPLQELHGGDFETMSRKWAGCFIFIVL